jgi:Uma2 family endonuclease
VAKLKAYASGGIPAYWIVNLPKGRIEVYSQPTGPAETPSYRERHEYGPDDGVPVILDGREVGRIAAREILP